MTREERELAIEELQGYIIAEEHGKDGKPNGNVTCELTKGTIDLAIKALEQEPRWIPVSEKLPSDRDWYLGIFKEPDTGWINPLPFVCDYVGKETKATTKDFWILHGFTDREVRDSDYYFNLECVAWMPLPKPYKVEMEIVNCTNTNCDNCVNHNYCDYEPYKAESEDKECH